MGAKEPVQARQPKTIQEAKPKPERKDPPPPPGGYQHSVMDFPEHLRWSDEKAARLRELAKLYGPFKVDREGELDEIPNILSNKLGTVCEIENLLVMYRIWKNEQDRLAKAGKQVAHA